MNLTNLPISQLPSRRTAILKMLLYIATGEILLVGGLWVVMPHDPPQVWSHIALVHLAILLLIGIILIVRQWRLTTPDNRLTRGGKWVVAIGTVIEIGLLVLWQYGFWPELVHAVLATNGRAVTAHVVDYHRLHHTTRSEYEVFDFAQADRLVVTVSYDNGRHQYTLAAERDRQHPEQYAKLNREIIQDHQIQLRYWPALPELARPELEFSQPQTNPYSLFR